MNRILARTATLGLGLVAAGLAFGASIGSAAAAPVRTPAAIAAPASLTPPQGTMTLNGAAASGQAAPTAPTVGGIANPVRPTGHECKPHDPSWGCGGPADPDDVTESTDCSMTQGQDPANGNIIFREFCITSSTYWEGQDANL